MPALLAACREAQRAQLAGEDFQTLTEEEANEYDAIAERIIPTTDTPGAREAGVIYFIDTVLGDRREEILAVLKTGLRELQTNVVLEFDLAYFHLLDEVQQDQVLNSVAESDFFRTIRYLTVSGMFALPEYGGNRDSVGYQVIAYDDQHAWAPPYGFYDADFMERGE